jgi:glycosyltransferase involved in cell wall biosynthesis
MSGAAATGVASVVIPCFDQAHFLAEAIESVISQTQDGVEIVVVDDGSSDNSFEVAGRYPEARRLRQDHRGVAAARNLGMRESSVEFLVFLDADDRLLAEAVEVGMRALAKRPGVAFAAGMSRDIAEDGRVVGGSQQPLVTQDHYVRLLEDCFIWSGSSVVYRRLAIEAVGGFNEGLDAGDDYELYLNVARRHPIFCHDKVVTEYRRHGSNTTRDARLVLTSELQVLWGQQTSLRDGRDRTAWRAGLRNVRSRHGRAVAAQAAVAWSRHDWRRASRGIGTLVRRCPTALPYFAKEIAGARGAGRPQAAAAGADR